MNEPEWENRSSYRDPTARAGEREITKDEQRVTELVHCLRAMARIAGFEIMNRVELRDVKTRRTFR